MLCGLVMQQCANLLHPWCIAVLVCNNSEDNLFLIKCIHSGHNSKKVKSVAFSMEDCGYKWYVHRHLWKTVFINTPWCVN